MGKRQSNNDFSFLPVLPVSSVKDRSKSPKGFLLGGQCFDRIMFCLKPFEFNDFRLKLTKYSNIPHIGNSVFDLRPKN